jgi:hypothetical protein
VTYVLARLLLACCLALSACGVADTSTEPSTATTSAPAGPQYLGQLRVPPGATLDGTVIGGLSGISYDPGSQLYYIVSDDRSPRTRPASTPRG